MLVTRTSTFSQFSSTLSNASLVQARLANAQEQLSSGFKTQFFQGLAGEVEAFTALDDKINRSTEFVKNNGITSTRINSLDIALENVIQSVTELRGTTLLRRNGTAAENQGYLGDLENKWATIASQLNINDSGLYLFGGTRTDSPPVAEDFPSLFNDEGLPESGYYQGSDTSTSIRLADGFQLDVDVRADDISIQQIYAGFALAREGHLANDEETIGEAFSLLSEGLNDLITLRTEVSTTQVSINESNAQQGQLQLYWRQVKDEMISTDLVSVSTQVAIDQSILQASFQAFASINALNLADFLR